jgi:S-layer protein (TIGR01567 family)
LRKIRKISGFIYRWILKIKRSLQIINRRFNLGIIKYTKLFYLILALGLLCGTAAALASNLTGDRIWDAKSGQSLTYTWTPQTYSGFYYDLNTGEGSENLTVQLANSSRSIDANKLLYETKAIKTEFGHKDWGSYDVIGFMAERYFAGYNINSSFVKKDISLISDGQLSKVLTDTNDRKSLYSGSSLVLEEGYTLNIVEVNVNGDVVHVQLQKDGKVLEDGFISSKTDYVYSTRLGSTEDVPVIAVHFSQIFHGTETDAVIIEGIFQISDQHIKINGNDKFGEMEVSSISDSGIAMKNGNSIPLSKGSTVNIMGKLNFIVADAEDLRFAPVVNMSEPGTYELRGTVHDEKFNTNIWTPYNFEGFYYNIDENVSTESLAIQKLNDKSIDSDMLVYSTRPALVKLNHNGWGSYEVLGFMAEKYFAGYPKNTFGNSSSVSVLSNNILSKVLIDEDSKKSLFSGSSLLLEEGYVLNVVEVNVNGNVVHVQLQKDGKAIDDGFIPSNGDYIYETKLGSTDSVPIIAVHFSQIFRGTEMDAVFVQGIFQISENYLKLSGGEAFDKMEISSISDSGITLKNKDSISLTRDSVIDLMGNVKFRVADSPALRFYPFVNFVSAAGDQLVVEVPNTLVVGKETRIRVTARNVSVSEVNLLVDSRSIGLTGDDGMLNYTPDKVGSFKISAEKAGYVSGNKNVDIVGQGVLKLQVSVSPKEVKEGDQITIKVMDSVENRSVAGADVFFGGKKIAQQTDANGAVSYWVTAPGTFMINATKAGNEEGKTSIVVAEKAVFKFSNLTIVPSSVAAGKAVDIKVNVTNNGSAAAESKVELLVNNRSVDSKNVSLDAGKNTVVAFSHTENQTGTYAVGIGDQSQKYEVTKKAPFLSGIATLGILATAFVLLRKRRS